MNLDDAIQFLQDKIKTTSTSATVKVFKMSPEEARLSIYVPAGEVNILREAIFQPTLDLLNNDGLDIQVFIYDRDSPPLNAGN